MARQSAFHELLISRRHALATSLASSLALMTMDVNQSFAAAAPAKTLQQPRDIKLLETRLKMQLEVAGEARLKDPNSKQATTAPIKSQSTLDYLETIAYRNDQPLSAARHYISASSEHWVGGKAIQRNLRPDVAHQRVVREQSVWEQYAPAQPLERREVELLRAPLNSLALEKLLPLEPARTDSRWTISCEDAKELFNLEAVHKSTIACRIVAVDKGLAKIELQGQIQGTANSVSTEIEVKGQAHAIMTSQCALISWVGVSIKESRDISELQPGFVVTARAQVVRQELTGKLPVSYDQLTAVAAEDDPGRWLVRVDSKCNFSMLTGRNWITFMDSGEDAILRLVENNKVVAQCNIAPLPKLNAGTHLSLEGLQEDIKKSLGKNFDQFLESSERITGTKLRLVRVEAEGHKDEVAVRWVYSHLSDDLGRRIALVYTLGAEDGDKFANCDMQMLDSFEFTGKDPATTQPETETKSETASGLRLER
jgi:hypothetical protein